MVAAVALAAGMTAGVSGAAGPTTNVTFTPVTNYKVLSNAYIGANLTRNVVVIGGATPVPTNATTVRLTVTAKGTKAGTLSFYPTGNPAGSNGQTLSWAPGATVTGTITADIGENESLTFKNTSAASATVTAILTGFSTEVAAGDISGAGGTAGQALINNGTGGATWGEPGRAYSSYFSNFQVIPFLGADMRTLTLPAGTWVVSFNGTVNGSDASPDFARCWLLAPAGTIVNGEASVSSAVIRSTMAMQGIWKTATGGTVRAFCWSTFGQTMHMSHASLIAHSVGTVTGSFVSGKSTARPPSR